MTTTYKSILGLLIPARFALRTLCPGIYAYAKKTGWPSSYAQLLRDRRLIDASLYSFYASLKLSRLRDQVATQVKTPRFEAIVYHTSEPAVSFNFQSSAWKATSSHSISDGCAEVSASSTARPLRAPVSNGTIKDATRRAFLGDHQPVVEEVLYKETTSDASSARQSVAGPLGRSTMVAVVYEEQKKDLSEPSKQPADHLKGWVESAIRFACTVHDSSREGLADFMGVKTRSVCDREIAHQNTHQASKRNGPRRLVHEVENLNSGASWLFFVHGGAFVLGSPSWYRLVINDLSVHTGAKVFCPNYRLAPENPWPAQLEDCRAAYEHMCQTEGVKGENIIVAGDSAGGNLAIALVLSIIEDSFKHTGNPGRDGVGQAHKSHRSLSMPAGLLLMSPWLDLSMKGPSYILNRMREPVLPLESIQRAGCLYLHGDFQQQRCLSMESSLPWRDFDLPTMEHTSYGDRTASNPWVSPVYARDLLLAKMPPTLIHVGSPEVLLSDSLIFARRVNEAVRGALLPAQAWAACDREAYQNALKKCIFETQSTSGTSLSLGNLPIKMTYEGTGDQARRDSSVLKCNEAERPITVEGSPLFSGQERGGSVAEATVRRRTHGDSFLPTYSHRESDCFRQYGWLGEEDIYTLENTGVVWASGCTEDFTAQVKIWKDEFHVVSC